jgi:DNA replication protein DnaC
MRIRARRALYTAHTKLGTRREAGTGKTLSTLDNSVLSRTNQALIAKLHQDLSWAHHADNILLIGPSGTGKTHIANALGYRLIEQGIRCKLFPAIGLVQQLQQAKRELDLMSEMSKLDKYQVIIIDDIGYVKKPMQKPRYCLNLSRIDMKAVA